MQTQLLLDKEELVLHYLADQPICQRCDSPYENESYWKICPACQSDSLDFMLKHCTGRRRRR